MNCSDEVVIDRNGLSRRRALKGGAALTVGAVVWTEPTIRGLARRPAYAASASGDCGGPYVNLAPAGTASQSSTAFAGPAAFGNDGNTNGNYSADSVFHTGQDSPGWWEVDLGSVCYIDSVVLWNRTDCCQDRASDVQVAVDSIPQGTAAGTIGSPSTVSVGASGQVVRVTNGRNDWFHLAEVQVFGCA